MSKPPRPPPPSDWRHGGPLPEQPPHLRSIALREDPEVRELLAELSEGLEPGEDPLFYALPEAPPDDPDACAPDAMRVYVPPTALPEAHHATLELARVKLAPHVDPRRAETVRLVREDAPPTSKPASARVGGVPRGRVALVVAAIGVVGVAVGVVATRSPAPRALAPEEEATARPSATATPGPSATATEAPSATAAPSMTAAPSAIAVPSTTAPRLRPIAPPEPQGRALDDPYRDAVAPSPPQAVSVAPAPPAPPSPAAPSVKVPNDIF